MKLIKYILHEYLTKQDLIEDCVDCQPKKSAKLMDKIILEYSLHLQEDEEAAQQAKDQGLQHIGGGYWSKTGVEPATHTTRGGTLRALTPDEIRDRQQGQQKAEPEQPVSRPEPEQPKTAAEPEDPDMQSMLNDPEYQKMLAKLKGGGQIRTDTPKPDKSTRSIIRNYIDYISSFMMPKVVERYGTQFANQYKLDMIKFANAIAAGDQTVVDEMKEKYGLYFTDPRTSGKDVYIYTKSMVKNVNGQSEPFLARKGLGAKGSNSLKRLTTLARRNGIELPSESEVAGSAYRNTAYAPSTLVNSVGSNTPVVLEKDGSIRIGGNVLKQYDLDTLQDPQEKMVASLINGQIDIMKEHLFNKDGSLNGTAMQGQDAAIRIGNNLGKAIMEDDALTPDRKQGAVQRLEAIVQSDASNLDRNVSEFVAYLSAVNDSMRSSRSIIVETVSTIRETKRGSQIIIPNSPTFPLGDFVVIRRDSEAPLLTEISIDFSSVKFGGGAASALQSKIAMSYYSPSESYPDPDKLKTLLLQMSSTDDGSDYKKIWGGDETELGEVRQSVDQLIDQNRDMIMEYYGVEGDKNWQRILESWDAGWAPEIKNGQVVRSKKNIAPMRKGQCTKKDPLHKQRWQTYSRSGHIQEILNNVHIAKQGFSNTDYDSRTGEIRETNGGTIPKEKSVFAGLEFTANTTLPRNPCKTAKSFATSMKPRSDKAVRMAPSNPMIGETRDLIRQLVVKELEKLNGKG